MLDTKKIKNQHILKVPDFDFFLKSLNHSTEYKKFQKEQDVNLLVETHHFYEDMSYTSQNDTKLKVNLYRYIESYFSKCTDRIVNLLDMSAVIVNSDMIKNKTYRHGKFKARVVLDYLLDNGFGVVKKDIIFTDSKSSFLLLKHDTQNLMIVLTVPSGVMYNLYSDTKKPRKKKDTFYELVASNIFTLDVYYTTELTDNFDTFVDFLNLVDSSYVPNVATVEKRAELNIVGSDRDGYRLREKNIYSKDSKYTDLDLHYGEGFEEKYNILIDRLIETKKGLVLFHGEPGTGKTQTLRNIILKLSEHKKIIYVPSNMVESILDPSFMTFLSEVASEMEEEHKNILMIIEDAENLIVKRVGIDSARVSNILNSADGLLNDYLNLQLIITFNADMNDIDEAILREERLIADFKFTTIPKERQIKLMEKLGIKNYDVNYDYNTLAEIYSLDKNRRTIRFNSDSLQSSNKFGFTE